jgi:hypothetical protein
MVELGTINKALPGDSPDYHFPFWLKARWCFYDKLSFGYFWSLTISGGDQNERRTGDAYENGSYTTYNTLVILGDRTLWREALTPHTWVVLLNNANSKCGGGMWVPQVSSFHVKYYLDLKMVLVLASCSIKKRKKRKRSYHGGNSEFFINKTPW